jgi:hypothetical protein
VWLGELSNWCCRELLKLVRAAAIARELEARTRAAVAVTAPPPRRNLLNGPRTGGVDVDEPEFLSETPEPEPPWMPFRPGSMRPDSFF